jgi:hypothetical protein
LERFPQTKENRDEKKNLQRAGYFLTLVYSTGESSYAQTGSFGFYRFDDLVIGETYILTICPKRFTFPMSSQIIILNEDLTEVNFISKP